MGHYGSNDFKTQCPLNRLSPEEAQDSLDSLPCLQYHVRGGNLASLEWVTVAVVGKHDDSADRRTGHDHAQTHLVDKDSPEVDSRHNYALARIIAQ